MASFETSTGDDRLALCRWLNTDPRTTRIPALLISRTIDGDIVRQATEAGVLGLAILRRDGTKLVSAVQGVLAADARTRPGHRSLAL